MLSLVVSICSEDISWIKCINLDLIKIHLYTRGKNTSNVPNHDNIIYEQIPDEYGDSHVYLYHIIKNYYYLDDKIIFTTGHLNNKILEFFNKIFKENFPWVSSFYKYMKKYKVPLKSNIDFGEWMEKNVAKLNKNTFLWSPHGFFSVNKFNIYSRPLDYYVSLRKQLKLDNIELEKYLERAWYYIFNLHKEQIFSNPDFVVVGSGLSGSVIAERLSNHGKVLIIEKREHIGGNCYDYIDSETNILVSRYGAHLFHTNNEDVWEYVNKFSEWFDYKHKVYGKIADKIFPIPININTVNILCNQSIKNEHEMNEYLDSVRDKSITDPKNSEEYCLMKFGKELYEKIIKEYTFKQWNKYPNELDASVLKRIPVRYDFSEGYFTDKYQALPKNGYTKFIENIVANDNILVLFNQNFFDLKEKYNSVRKIFYTGPIDQFYESSGHEKLEYRSIYFEYEIHKNKDYYQENSVINYPSSECNYTRIVEYKHFYKNDSSDTLIAKEYSIDDGDPYYPVPNEKNLNLYEKYKKLAQQEENVVFLGRLASYKYFNMDEAIACSLNVYKNFKIESFDL
jgi:UDP-galactopyranose mutase